MNGTGRRLVPDNVQLVNVGREKAIKLEIRFRMSTPVIRIRILAKKKGF